MENDQPSERNLSNGGNGNGRKVADFNDGIEATAAYSNILHEITDIKIGQSGQTQTLNGVKAAVDDLRDNPMIQLGVVIKHIPGSVKWGLGFASSASPLLLALHALHII